MVFAAGAVPLDQRGHLFQARFDYLDTADVAAHHIGDKNVAQRGIFPAWRKDRQVFLASGIHPRVFGIDLEKFANVAVADELIHEFIRKEPLALAIGFLPVLQDLALDAAHGLFLGDARIGHAIEAALAQGQFFVIGQIAVIGDAAVMIVRDEIENIFFEVGARGAYGVHFILPDHLRKR